MARETTRVRRRERKNITSGVVHVNSSFNNTMVTITDAQGNTISWSSAGAMGFKGSRKSTPFAASRASEKCGGKVRRMGMRELEDGHGGASCQVVRGLTHCAWTGWPRGRACWDGARGRTHAHAQGHVHGHACARNGC